jgi:hypothetical protein
MARGMMAVTPVGVSNLIAALSRPGFDRPLLSFVERCPVSAGSVVTKLAFSRPVQNGQTKVKHRLRFIA